MSPEEIALATTGSIAEPDRKARTSVPFVAILPEMDSRLSDFLPACGDIGFQRGRTSMVAKSPADTQKRRVKAMPKLSVGVGGSIRDTANPGEYKPLPTDAYRKMAEHGVNWGIGYVLRSSVGSSTARYPTPTPPYPTLPREPAAAVALSANKQSQCCVVVSAFFASPRHFRDKLRISLPK